jgi:hypothetical protein
MALLASGVAGLAIVSETDGEGRLGRIVRAMASAGPARLTATGQAEITIPVDNGQIRWSAFPNDTSAIERDMGRQVVAIEPSQLPDTKELEAFFDQLAEDVETPAGRVPSPPRLPRPRTPIIPVVPEPRAYTAPADGSPATVGLKLEGRGGRFAEHAYGLAGTVAHTPGTIGLHEQSSEFDFFTNAPDNNLGRDFGSSAWVDGEAVKGPLAFLLLRPDAVFRLLGRAENASEIVDRAVSFTLSVPDAEVTGVAVTDERDRLTSVAVTARGSWGQGLTWRVDTELAYSYGQPVTSREVQELMAGVEITGPGAFVAPPTNGLVHALTAP